MLTQILPPEVGNVYVFPAGYNNCADLHTRQISKTMKTLLLNVSVPVKQTWQSNGLSK